MSGYRVKKENNYPLITGKHSKSILTQSAIPNIFQVQNNSYKYGKDRVHCEAIERKAIYIDKNGNKVILQENTTTMNTDGGIHNIQFTNRGKRFKERRK